MAGARHRHSPLTRRPGTLVCRYFWVDRTSGTISWDKKKRTKGNKSEPLLAVEPEPKIRSAEEWFASIDADGSGELDAEELSTLYKRARGEKLKGKDLKAAMAEMDTDASGTSECGRRLSVFRSMCCM